MRASRRLTLAAIVLSALGTAVPIEGQIDPSGDWQTWHTEHFRVHAKAKYESFAFKGAREAERAYRALATELRPPRGTIDLVLGDNVDFSNGYATVMPSNRIVIYLTPPSTAISTGNYDIWLRLVIVHELAHVFHLDRADGMWNVLQTVFGRAPGLFPNAYQPMWVTEGLATYYESKYTTAGRERGFYFEQLLTGAARDDKWPTPGEATFANRVWPAGARPYAWGSRFFEAELKQFGDSVLPQYIDNTSRQLIVFNVNSPMKGAGTDGVDGGWGRLRANSERGGLTGALIVRGLRSEPRPRVSADGRLLAYRNNDGKNIERLIVHDLASGTQIASHRTNLVEGLVWIDSTLFLTQLEFDSPVDIRSDLYRWIPGGDWDRMTRGSRDTDVFASRFGRLGVIGLDTAVREVRTVNHETMEGEQFPVPAADDWGRIAVSPGGDWVAAARHTDGRWDIVIWPWDRPNSFEYVTDDPAMDADPVWSADGSRLLFASERGGMPQVYSYDMADKETSRITNEPTGAREPAITPDGTLYYSTALSDGYAIVQQRGPLVGMGEPELPAQGLQVDSAPVIAVRESGYAPWGALRPHFWIPIAHDEESSGVFFGALTSGVDAIERTAYSTVVTVAPSTGRWEGVLSLLHSRWRSWSVDLSGAQTWDYGGWGAAAGGDSVQGSFRERAIQTGVRHRWRRWRTATSTRLGTFVEQDKLVSDGDEPFAFAAANPTFWGGILSAAISHLERPALAISPENGGSISGFYLRRWEIGGPEWSYELRGAANGYLALSLPGFSHWVLAGRVSAGLTGGSFPSRYSIGGESGDLVPLVPGSNIGSGRRTFSMRGYPRAGRFTRAFVGITELRIPIWLAGRSVGRLPLLIDKVASALFWELGGGWNEGDDPTPAALSDVGVELTVDLGIGAGLLLRTRVGLAVALKDWGTTQQGDVRAYIAFGPSF